MLVQILIFIAALITLLASARFFTSAAETLGKWMRLPAFVIGVFIVGIGTSLPELISGILAIKQGSSEILPGNIIGANISNLFLVTGLAVGFNRKGISLGSTYIYIDLHFLLGAFVSFYIIAYDGVIHFAEAFIGIIIFLLYSIYLIKGGVPEVQATPDGSPARQAFPLKALLIILATGTGIYLGADYTISSISAIAAGLSVPESVIALTALSVGTTLPELAVNITAIRRGKAEMAIGNILGSCIFNSLSIPAITSLFGDIHVPDGLLSFSLPVMAAAGGLFYLLSQDKLISRWEGFMFVMLYLLFILKTAGI